MKKWIPVLMTLFSPSVFAMNLDQAASDPEFLKIKGKWELTQETKGACPKVIEAILSEPAPLVPRYLQFKSGEDQILDQFSDASWGTIPIIGGYTQSSFDKGVYPTRSGDVTHVEFNKRGETVLMIGLHTITRVEFSFQIPKNGGVSTLQWIRSSVDYTAFGQNPTNYDCLYQKN